MPPAVVRGAATPADVATANDLMAKTQAPPYWDCMRWLDETGPAWPCFRTEHTRMAYVDGELAGALRILTLTLRIGRARLRAGGIGWVSTATAFRNRGVCRALMADAHEYLQTGGYHLSLLFGVPGLYQKFGYVTAIPMHSIVCQAADLTGCGLPGPPVRPVAPTDAEALRRMHQAHDTESACSIVRSKAYFATLFGCTARTIPYPPEWDAAIAVLDGQRLAGYFMPQAAADEVYIKEVGIDRPSDADSLLGALAAWARSRGHGRLRIHVPPHHPIALRLRDFEARHEAQYFRDREGMLAAIDISKLAEAMHPEWEERLGRAGLLEAARDMALDVDGQAVHIATRAQQQKAQRPIARLTSQAFCRLIAGFDSGEGQIASGAVRLSGQSRQIFSTLFPTRTPFVWPIDHF